MTDLDNNIREELQRIHANYKGGFAGALAEVLSMLYKKILILEEKIDNGSKARE